MNCFFVIATECCKNNCQRDYKHDDFEEYEEEQTDEEDIEGLSTKTMMG